MQRRAVLRFSGYVVSGFLANGLVRSVWAKAPRFVRTISSTQPEAPDADLAFLLPILRGKSIIGLGEATHGSRELLEIKTRIVDLLIRRGHAGTVALELGFADGRALDRYVTGRSAEHPRATLKRIKTFSIANEQVLGLICRLHDFNRGRPLTQMVRVFGYDIQMPGREARLITEWLAQTGLHDIIAMGDHLRELAANPDKAIQAYSPAAALPIKREIAALTAALDAHSDVLAERSGAADLADVRYAAAVIGQAFDLFAAPSTEAAYDQRDASGAANIANLQRHDRRPIIVWAHNGHINKGSYEFAGARLLGGRLTDRLGPSYYAIATAFFQGEVRAAHGNEGVIVNRLPPARDGSIDAFLNAQGSSLFFADLRAARSDPAWRAEIFAKNVMRGVGGGYEPQIDQRTYRPTKLAEQFDGIVFVRSVTASTPLA